MWDIFMTLRVAKVFFKVNLKVKDMRKVLINLTTSILKVYVIDIVNKVKRQVKSLGKDICNAYSKDLYQNLCGLPKFKFHSIGC